MPRLQKKERTPDGCGDPAGGAQPAGQPPDPPKPTELERERAVVALGWWQWAWGRLAWASEQSLDFGRSRRATRRMPTICTGNVCDTEGGRLRSDAKDAATLSNVGFGVGILGVGTGVVLLLLRLAEAPRAMRPLLGLCPVRTPEQFGVSSTRGKVLGSEYTRREASQTPSPLHLPGDELCRSGLRASRGNGGLDGRVRSGLCGRLDPVHERLCAGVPKCDWVNVEDYWYDEVRPDHQELCARLRWRDLPL